MTDARVLLLGGRFNGHHAWLSRTPSRILAAGDLYERIDDPDTGESLGGYVAARAASEETK